MFMMMVTGYTAAQTYTITDVSAPGANPSFATGVNGNGQVSGYSTVGVNGAQVWRLTPGTGTVIPGRSEARIRARLTTAA